MPLPEARFIVSSVTIIRETRDGSYARIAVTTRGQRAGLLVVDAEDADTIARRLFGALPHKLYEERFSEQGTEREYRPWIDVPRSQHTSPQPQ